MLTRYEVHTSDTMHESCIMQFTFLGLIAIRSKITPSNIISLSPFHDNFSVTSDGPLVFRSLHRSLLSTPADPYRKWTLLRRGLGGWPCPLKATLRTSFQPSYRRVLVQRVAFFPTPARQPLAARTYLTPFAAAGDPPRIIFPRHHRWVTYCGSTTGVNTVVLYVQQASGELDRLLSSHNILLARNLIAGA